MSYVRNLFTAIGDYLWDNQDIDLDKFTGDYKKLCKSSIDPYLKKHRTIMDDEGHAFLTESITKFLLDRDITLSLGKVYKLEDLARRKTETQTFQAMEAMVHNLNTMQCFPGYERLWVFDKFSDQWCLFSFKELHQRFKQGRYYALSFDVETKQTEMQLIEDCVVRPNDKDIVVTHDSTGGTYTTTLDHRFLTGVYKTATNETILDLPAGKFPAHNLEVSKVITGYESAILLTQCVLPLSFKIPELKETKGMFFNSEETSISMLNQEELTKYQNKNLHLEDMLFSFNTDLAAFLGYYIAAGIPQEDSSSFDGPTMRFEISTHNTCDFTHHVEVLKSITKKLSIVNGDEAFFINGAEEAILVTFNKPLIFFVLDRICGKGMFNYHIPNFILSGTKELQDAFLEAMELGVSGDGVFHSYSVDLIADLRLLFLSRGAVTDKVKTDIAFDYGLKWPDLKLLDPKNRTCPFISKDNTHALVGIEEGTLAPEEDEVYDISVAKNQNFVLADGAIVHNSRAGSQTPFSSVNFGTDTSWEGRLVSKCTMQAFDKGLGKGETAIFPIAIFRMKKGITDKGSPNYDLFKMSCEVSAKRLFPNWVNVDAPYNLKYYKPEDPRTQIAAMGATAKGMVALAIYDTKGEVMQTFIGDISLAGEVLLLYPEVINNQNGSKTYQVFDEHTFYLELDPNRVKIADSYSGTRKWVGVKKFMFWADPRAKWIRFTYRYQAESDTRPQFADGFSEKKKTESPDNLCDKEFSRRRKNFDMELIVTEDHPLSVYDYDLKKYVRTEADDIPLGVQLQPTNPSAVEAIWISDRDEYHPNGTLVGYDFETESDHFDLDYIVSHNCRTRVISNVYDPKHEICYGRGNLFWTTLNLPYIALEVKESLERVTYPDGYSKQLLIDTFFKRLDKEIDDILDFSRDRLRIISKRKAFNYPFAMGQHEYVDSEKLNLNDTIAEVIKQGTISVGFIGLAETLIALIGKHHGESEEAQELGLKIVGFMRARMDQESKNTNMNYSLMATPAEGCTGRLCKLIAKRFGIIPGITDKKYLVNSSHVPPKFHISVADKIRIEAPYHELENAGHIFYCEQDADISKNPEALEDIVTMAADAGCGYIAVNHPVTRDPVCGYVGPLNPDGTCPRCGRKEYEGVTARKLLNLTAYSPDPEYAVTSEKLEDEDKTINDL